MQQLESIVEFYMTSLHDYLYGWDIYPGLTLCEAMVVPFHREIRLLTNMKASDLQEELRFATRYDISFLEDLSPENLRLYTRAQGQKRTFQPMGDVVYHRNGCNIALVNIHVEERYASITAYAWYKAGGPGAVGRGRAKKGA